LLTANRTKKGYYIRRLKDCLWCTFGINRIRPFEDNYSKEQMRAWKQQENVKKVHEDLYSPSNPDDPSSDMYVAVIIKSVFTEKEQMQENVIWAMSVLETIFDENHLSTKIDADVIESWKESVLKNKEQKVINNVILLYFFIISTIKILYFYLLGQQ
jgi:hypothetical protein